MQWVPTHGTSQLKRYQIFHMEDLMGEIYFSKRQNVSWRNSLVMHKGLLSLWRSILQEKCWDNFYILITEDDLIKIVLDIKIAWGRESFSGAGGKSKRGGEFGQHFEVALTKRTFQGLIHKVRSPFQVLWYTEQPQLGHGAGEACSVQPS